MPKSHKAQAAQIRISGGRKTITVEWGDEEHSITLTPRDWARVKSGKELRIRGKGYNYEGEFWDYWHFTGGLQEISSSPTGTTAIIPHLDSMASCKKLRSLRSNEICGHCTGHMGDSDF